MDGQLIGTYVSEAGTVCRKMGGVFVGFPYCLQHLESKAEDDRSYAQMVRHRAKHYYDQTEELIAFKTLLECQLAVEAAYFKWQRKFVGAGI